MYKIAVSPEQLEAFADKIEKFKKDIMSECEYLQQQADVIKPFVDETTGLALLLPAKEIVGVVAEKEDLLKELINNAYAYAGTVRDIQRKIAAEKAHQNRLKEKACGTACSVVMYEHIKAMDSEYRTMDGYAISRAKSIIDGVTTAAEAVTGVTLKAQLVPTDEAHIDGQIDDAIKLIDAQIALCTPNKVINRSGTAIPQEQVDSHTLVIGDADESR